MSAGGGRWVRVEGWVREAEVGSWFLPDPSRLSAPSHLAIPLCSLPQLSFSIVSLCNHLTRSLMKRVHQRANEDLVGKHSAL